MPSYPYFTKKIKTGGSVTIISPKFRGSISATVNCWRAGLCDGLSKLSGNVYHIRDVAHRKRAPLYGSEPLFQAHCHKIQNFFSRPSPKPRPQRPKTRRPPIFMPLPRSTRQATAAALKLHSIASPPLQGPKVKAHGFVTASYRRSGPLRRLMSAGTQFQLGLGRMWLVRRALRSAPPISRRSNLARPPTLRAAAAA